MPFTPHINQIHANATDGLSIMCPGTGHVLLIHPVSTATQDGQTITNLNSQAWKLTSGLVLPAGGAVRSTIKGTLCSNGHFRRYTWMLTQIWFPGSPGHQRDPAQKQNMEAFVMHWENDSTDDVEINIKTVTRREFIISEVVVKGVRARFIWKIGFRNEVIAAFFSIISVVQAGPLRAGCLPQDHVRAGPPASAARRGCDGGRHFTQNRRLHPGPQPCGRGRTTYRRSGTASLLVPLKQAAERGAARPQRRAVDEAGLLSFCRGGQDDTWHQRTSEPTAGLIQRVTKCFTVFSLPPPSLRRPSASASDAQVAACSRKTCLQNKSG